MRQPNPEPSRHLTSQRLQEMGYAYKQSGVLIGAIELDLFSAVSKGATSTARLAATLGMTEDHAERLVTACLAMGLLEGTATNFRNAPDVDRYLVRDSPAFFGDGLVNTARGSWDSYRDVSRLLRPPRKSYDSVAQNPRAAREMTVAGYNYSIAAARKLAREIDLSSYRHLLDLGGGSGAYSIALCQAYPQLRATVLDYATVLEVAKEFIAQGGLEARISTMPGDFMQDSLPSGADLALLSGNLQAYDQEEAALLMKRAFEVLKPGGRLLVSDYMVNDERSGPLEPAFMNMGAVLSHVLRPGRVHSYQEVADYMTAAGFVNIQSRREWIPGILGLVMGDKPR